MPRPSKRAHRSKCGDPECKHVFAHHNKGKCTAPGCKCSRFLAILSPREFQILQFIFKSTHPTRIAIELGVSYKTVEAERYNLFNKTGVHSAIDLVIAALKCGIVKLDDLPNPGITIIQSEVFTKRPFISQSPSLPLDTLA